MEKKSIWFHLSFWGGTIALLLLDQWSKHMAVLHLKDRPGLAIIPKVFCLQYLENRGAAFGILQGRSVLFILMTVLLFLIVCWIYAHLEKTKRFYPVYLIMALFLAGALGNFIDRITIHYVVDFFYFELINFPIFNVADIYVTCAAALFLFFFLVIYKEKDLLEMEEQIFPWKKEDSK